MAEESPETPQHLIWFEHPVLIDVGKLAPHFQHQLLHYFDRLDEFSTFYSLIFVDPNTADYTGLTIGQPTSRYLHYQRNRRINPALPVNIPDDRIPERMMYLQEKMDILAPMIRERINIIGRYGVNVATGRRLFLCENMDDIRAVQVYRQLMPPNFPQIRMIMDTRNHESLQLAEIARGVQFVVDLRIMDPR